MKRLERSARRLLGSLGLLLAGLGVFAGLAPASGDANHLKLGECSAGTEASPGFREYLPDCRAYELVTPPFKYGEPPSFLAISADGAGYAFSSIGAFGEPGNNSSVEGGEYVASRGATTWSARSVNPSATQFQGGSPDPTAPTKETLDYSANLSQTLFLQTPIGAAPIDQRFYLRSVADGSSLEVGPTLPRETVAAWTPSVANAGRKPDPRYTGGTKDLSHVLFTQQDGVSSPGSWLWPGDGTVNGPSLYEYVGLGNTEPELVGVNNQTSLAAAAAAEHKAHMNEAAEQISQCGIEIGGIESENPGSSRETYNTFSASGAAVFFTAIHGPCERFGKIGTGPAVDEVYARLDRNRTVAISEPTTGPGGDCLACDESEPQNALFQGASEDGSKVLFFSTQRLFSGANGEAGNNLYEFDFNASAGQKVSFVAPDLPPSTAFNSIAPGGVMRLSESGSRVYFLSQAILAESTPNEFGAVATAGADNLYVYDTATHRETFAATLSPEDSANWNGTDAIRSNETAADYATPDGRFLLFSSVADLTSDASGEARQLYRYDAVPSEEDEARHVPRLVRVTVGASGSYRCPVTGKTEEGFNCDGNVGAPPSSFAFSPQYVLTAGPLNSSSQRARPAAVAISSDGTRVFFQSPVGLTPTALNNVCAYEEFGECFKAAQNIYEWEDGHVYLISDGRDAKSVARSSAVQLVGANPSGSDVFFTTADQLSPQDTDTQMDGYDARIGGGFPGPLASAACQDEACQGPLAASPTFGAPSSATLSGQGNVTPVLPAGAAPTKVKPKAVKCLRTRRRKSDRQRRKKCVRTKANRKKGHAERPNDARGRKP